MSIFETLGRQVERAKQSYTSDDTHACRSCRAGFDFDYNVCPECGAEDVVALE